MSPLHLLLFVVVLPALVAAVSVVAAGWAGHRAGVAGAGPAAVALALGTSAIAAQLGVALPAFPPIDVAHRIAWLVGTALVLGVFESVAPSPAWARWENRLLLAVLVLGTVLGPVLGPDWPTRRDLTGQGGLVLVVLVAWLSLEAQAAGRSTAILGPSVVVVAAGIAAALLLSGSLVLGQIGGGLAAALGVVWVVSWWLPDRSLSRGGVPVLVATWAALLIEGKVYSGLPLAAAFLLGAAPTVSWLAFVGPARRLAPWQSGLLAAVLAVVPVGVAVGLAVQAAPGGYE